ncbi:MAG: leucyl/phenylalanyl-tRNA--protein transferase [Lacibacter sp.]
MPIPYLTEELWFPPADQTTGDGIVAIGGDLSPNRLLLAYQKGIFPWYNEDEPPIWWCPDPRFVLFPNELRVSKSMKQLFRKEAFHVTYNKAFEAVIHNCGATREDFEGTWISNDIKEAYNTLHRMGYAMSAEAWLDNQLVGGLYGIKLGTVFFGESMFSTVSNASKYAFISLTEKLQQEGLTLIDCQIYTEHLESLGGRDMNRSDFLRHMEEQVGHIPFLET